MNCPICNNPSKVTVSRRMKRESKLKRRRKCTKCGYRWTTYQGDCEEEIMAETATAAKAPPKQHIWLTRATPESVKHLNIFRG